jgi:hypothetical protein
MAEPHDDHRETVERTTIIETDRRGGGGLLTAVLLILALLALAYLFRDQLGFGGDRTEISVPDKIDVNIN